MRILLPLLVMATALTACLGTDTPAADMQTDRFAGFELTWAPGAVGTLTNKGDARAVTLPATFLIMEEDTFALAEESTLEAGQSLRFLAPPSLGPQTFLVDGQEHTVQASPSGASFVDGHNVIELMKFQEANFPHREPGEPNYWPAVEYFRDVFQELGYEVEVDPYGTHEVTEATMCLDDSPRNSICAESLANVVAYKPGTDPEAGDIFVAGGHFDMVPQTTHAAFDDTSGTIATLELARAMAPYQFRHGIYFGLWGGEENAILGSQFWVQTNPEARESLKSYWNLDVVGMSWPAPLPKPDPIVIAAGPDVPTLTGGAGDPVTADLLSWARTLQQGWFDFPDHVNGEPMWYYEGIASGQVAGYAGVNAQSDHTPFAAAGIPSYFIFNGDALAGDNPVRLHTETDTLRNMTKYAWYANDFDLDVHAWESPEIERAAEQVLSDSFETILWFPFYHAVLVDLGVYDPPTAASTALAQVPTP